MIINALGKRANFAKLPTGRIFVHHYKVLCISLLFTTLYWKTQKVGPIIPNIQFLFDFIDTGEICLHIRAPFSSNELYFASLSITELCWATTISVDLHQAPRSSANLLHAPLSSIEHRWVPPSSAGHRRNLEFTNSANFWLIWIIYVRFIKNPYFCLKISHFSEILSLSFVSKQFSKSRVPMNTSDESCCMYFTEQMFSTTNP